MPRPYDSVNPGIPTIMAFIQHDKLEKNMEVHANLVYSSNAINNALLTTLNIEMNTFKIIDKKI